MSIFRNRFQSAKCKALLKLVLIRITIARKKHEIQLKHMRQDVSRFLQLGQVENAQTRVAHVLREQNALDAFNMLESFCELVIKHMSILRAQKACPANLLEAISSLLFAGPRCAKLPELLKVRKVFAAKYGKDFIAAAVEPDNNSGVSKEIIEKLSSSTLIKEAKVKHIMQEIALEYGIKWDHIALESELGQECRDCDKTNHSKYTITDSISETLCKASRSESLLLTSTVQAKESFSLSPLSSSDSEDDAHFDGRNQFIVSVMQIRTLGVSDCEVKSHKYTLQDQINSCNPHVEPCRRTLFQKQQQVVVDGSCDSFMEEFKTINTEMESNISYGDVSVADTAAKSADHAAVAARTSPRFAMNALSQKTLISEGETGTGEDDLICGPASKTFESNFLIPVQSWTSHPVKVSVQIDQDPQHHTATQSTSLSTDHFCNGHYPIMDPGMKNKSSDGKKKINSHTELENEEISAWSYNTGTILPLKTNSQKAADQHSEFNPSLKPFEPSYRYHDVQSDNFISNPGPKETGYGSHPISSSNHNTDYQTSQASEIAAGAEKSADLLHSCTVNVQLNGISRNISKQKTCQDLSAEQTRHQENTKIHPVASIPGISLSKKKSSRPRFYKRMHSCLLG